MSGAAAGVVWPATDGTAVDVTNGNYCANAPTLCVLAKNTGGSPYTLTFVTQSKAGSFAVEDDVKTLAAGAQKAFGPFPANVFGTTLEFNGENVAVKVIPFQTTKV
jgi:hypothetical protein